MDTLLHAYPFLTFALGVTAAALFARYASRNF